MAYENKGSMATTVTVSLYPDVSGNFVCSADEAHDVTIQRAIDHVVTLGRGGSIHIKEGQYNITATITVGGDDITVKGKGDGTLLYMPNAADIHPLMRTNGLRVGVVFRDFKIDGNGTNQTVESDGLWMGSGPGAGVTEGIIDKVHVVNARTIAIRVQYGGNNFVRDCTVETTVQGGGIWVGGSPHTSVIGCYVSGSEQSGIALDDSPDGLIDSHYCGIYDCIVNGTNLHGINLELSQENCVVSGNIIRAFSSYGIMLHDGATFNDIIGNTIEGGHVSPTVGDGIYMQNATDSNILANNIIDNVERYGIYVQNGGIRNIIQGNIINNSGTVGIYFNAVTYSTISENMVYSAGDHGINVLNSDYIRVNDNYVTGTTANRRDLYIANSDNNDILDNTLLSTCVANIEEFGTSDFNRIFGNRLENGTNLAVILGANTSVPFIFCRVTDPTGNLGNHPVVTMPDDTDTYIYDQFYVPLEYQELVTAQIVVVQSTGANPNMVWTCDTDWGKLCSGEDYLADSDSTGATSAMAQDDLVCLDISAALTGIAAGDLIGVSFMRDGDNGADTINGPAYYLGIRIRYV